jgi:hypothetical protein
VEEISMEAEPPENSAFLWRVSDVEGLEKGDIINGDGSLYRKHEAPEGSPFGKKDELIQINIDNLKIQLTHLSDDANTAELITASCNTAIANLSSWLTRDETKEGKGPPLTAAQGGDPELEGKTTEERIVVYQERLTKGFATKAEIVARQAALTTEIHTLEQELAAITQAKAEWLAANS